MNSQKTFRKSWLSFGMVASCIDRCGVVVDWRVYRLVFCGGSRNVFLLLIVSSVELISRIRNT